MLDAGGVHAAQFMLEDADLVAEAGRDLELQLGGGRVHLLGELADQPDELAAGGAAGRAGLGMRDGLDRGAGPARQTRDRRLAARLLPAAAADQLLSVGVLGRSGPRCPRCACAAAGGRCRALRCTASACPGAGWSPRWPAASTG